MEDNGAVYYLARTNVVGHTMVSVQLDRETAFLLAETGGEYIEIVKVLFGMTQRILCVKCPQEIILTNP